MATTSCPICGAELPAPDAICICANSSTAKNENSAIKPTVQKKNKKAFAIIKVAVLVFVGLIFLGIGVNFVILGDRDTQWVTLRRKAQESYRHGDFKKAERDFLEAAKVAKELYGDADPKYLDTLEKLAWVHEEQEHYAPARRLFQKVKGMTPEDVMRFKAAQLLAYPSVSQMKNLTEHKVFRGAETSLRAGIQQLEIYLGPTDPGLAILYEALAENYERQRNFESAEEARIKLLSIRADSQGAVSAGAAKAHLDLARLYLNWGKRQLKSTDYETAKETFSNSKKSLELAKPAYEELFGKSDPRLRELPPLLEECTKLEQEAKVEAAKHPSPDTLPEYK